MLTTQELKQKACATIEKRKEEIIAIAKEAGSHPELGFGEIKTSRLVARTLNELGVQHWEGLAITGIKGRILGGGGPGPRVAVLGELDSLIVRDHPLADPETGAAHACGHHCQIGMMLGATMGVLTPDVLNQLFGEILPFAVPAEEFIQVEHRLRLREEGRLEFLGGKQELILQGAFEDVDIAMMCHTASNMANRKIAVGGTSNGHLVKYVQFIGRGSDAGDNPHLGINALNAATFALQAIDANRETFKLEDTVRVHGIISRGGDTTEVVPDDVRLEWRVRSATLESVGSYSRMVDRCFKAGALAMGAVVNITDIPGYLPVRHDLNLQELFRVNTVDLLGPAGVVVMPPQHNSGGSTDIGDLSFLMPVCHAYTAGVEGVGHSNNYLVTDYEAAVVNPAKIMAMVIVDLLADGGEKGNEVIRGHRPAMNRLDYLNHQRAQAQVTKFIPAD
jgi:amidohydrolase